MLTFPHYTLRQCLFIFFWAVALFIYHINNGGKHSIYENRKEHIMGLIHIYIKTSLMFSNINKLIAKQMQHIHFLFVVNA